MQLHTIFDPANGGQTSVTEVTRDDLAEREQRHHDTFATALDEASFDVSMFAPQMTNWWPLAVRV